MVVFGRQRLQVGADFVGHIAGIGGAVGARDNQIHHAVLHQMPTDIVDNDRVRYTMLAEFPGSQAGPLVTGSGFVYP